MADSWQISSCRACSVEPAGLRFDTVHLGGFQPTVRISPRCSTQLFSGANSCWLLMLTVRSLLFYFFSFFSSEHQVGNHGSWHHPRVEVPAPSWAPGTVVEAELEVTDWGVEWGPGVMRRSAQLNACSSVGFHVRPLNAPIHSTSIFSSAAQSCPTL